MSCQEYVKPKQVNHELSARRDDVKPKEYSIPKDGVKPNEYPIRNNKTCYSTQNIGLQFYP